MNWLFKSCIIFNFILNEFKNKSQNLEPELNWNEIKSSIIFFCTCKHYFSSLGTSHPYTKSLSTHFWKNIFRTTICILCKARVENGPTNNYPAGSRENIKKKKYFLQVNQQQLTTTFKFYKNHDYLDQIYSLIQY